MVPSSAVIVLQNRRISQSETSTINICDVVNIIALQHARVSGDQNVTKSANQASCQADGLYVRDMIYFI